MLTIVLAESELEVVPPEIQFHPAVLSHSKKMNKKPSCLILDSSFHHSALRKIPDGDRRGRPDIVHIFLLTTLDSIVNKEKNLKVIVHTRNNEAIYVNPETRLMRNYTRFIGLMEQLFKNKVIVSNDGRVLLELRRNVSLDKILKDEEYDFAVSFSSDGEKTSLSDFFKKLKKKNYENLLCVIGGFPRGGFCFDVKTHFDKVISIYDEMLSAWTVAGEVLVNYENVFLD